MLVGSSGLAGGCITAPTWGTAQRRLGLDRRRSGALGEAGLAGDALREAITTNPGHDGLPISRAVHALVPLPNDASEAVVWMSQARRLVGVIEEGAIA